MPVIFQMSMVENKLNFKASFLYLKLIIIKCSILGGVMLFPLLLIGCVPIPQHEMITSTGGAIRILPSYSDAIVDVLTNTSDPSQKPNIDVDRSYAVSPSGKRYSFGVQNSEFFDNMNKSSPTPWMRKLLSFHGSSRKNDDGNATGNWELNLYFTGPTSLPPIHAEYRMWTFWWFPLFERPF